MNPSIVSSAPKPGFGALVFYAYTFMVFSRLSEIMLIKLGSGFYLMPAMMLIAIGAVFLSGDPLRFVNLRPALWYLGFCAWMFVSLPFSVWKGGSVNVMVQYLRVALIFLVQIALVREISQSRKVMTAIALSLLLVLLFGLTMATDATGRLSLETGSLSNPNELAFHLLIGLPFCMVLSTKGGGYKWLSVGILLVSVMLIVKTGSRGALIGVLCLAAAVFVASRRKVMLAAGGIVLAVIGLLSASDQMAKRFATTFSSDRDLPIEAIQSRESRKALLIASLRLTAMNPIFGVGLGNFVVAYNDERFAQGLSHHWYVAHNAYTQISSELGIPGLLLYVGGFALVIRNLWRLRRQCRGRKELAHIEIMTFATLLSIWGFLFSGLFTSNSHQFYYPLLLGLGIVLYENAMPEVRRVIFGNAAPLSPPPLPWRPAVAPGTPQGRRLYSGQRTR